ncbi:MAG: hypothetical protein R8G01_12920 [Ilumatobacteraceae bacterium]|nr:hypothetical protein [Ilumatobacteraceae bacterium]
MKCARRNVSLLLCGALFVVGCSGGGGDGDAEPPTSEESGAVSDEASSDGDEPASEPDSEDDEAEATTGSSQPVATEPVDLGPLDTPIPAVEPVSVVRVAGDDVDGADETEETMPPADLLEVIERGVAAGSFSEAEGIARALNGVSGRGVPTPGLGPDDAQEAGLTALTRRGADLLESGDLDDDERTMLADALRFFSPSQELLDAISAPAPGPTAGFANASFGTGPAVSASAPPIEIIRQDCFDVVATGVSTSEALETGDECFHYVEEVVDGHELRVYYSSTWQTDPDQLALVDVALDGMVTSVGVFGGLATVGDINAVFSIGANGTTLASQSYFDLATPCPITLFTSASAGSMDTFRQTVAHEVFHCVQDWSFTSAPYATHKWWLEGSAEYFSNVVYPSVNDEHGWTPSFDSNSLRNDITQMSYENTVFFQYYANIRGDDATIDLLRTVSAAGATVESIASTSGMEKLWRDFVVAGAADAIFDTGGGTVGRLGAVIRLIPVDAVQAVELETSPMRAARYAVRYMKGKRYEQNTDESSHVSVAWANEATDLGAWTEMPVEVRPTCEKNRTYITVVTTAEEPVSPKANVSTAEQAVCDPCLLGTWGLQLGTFADYIMTVMESGGEQVPGMSLVMDGSYIFEFEADGTLSAVKDFTLLASIANVGAAPATKLTGTESGRYNADGDRITVTGWQGESTASIGDISSSVFSDAQGEASGYTCEDDVLTLTTLPYGPLVFDLLDGPPEPPPIIIETGG